MSRANETGARSLTLGEDEALALGDLLAEAEAIQEMSTRIKGDNQEDFAMLQSANRVTFRLLAQAREIVRAPE